MKKSFILLIFSATLISGCGLIETIKKFLNVSVPDISEQVIAALDRGINQLDVASADWQDVLNGVINDLPDEVQSTVTNEVANLLNRGIAATGAEVRCNVDFIRNRMKQSLQVIKARYLNTDIPRLEPRLCNVVPLAVDMSLSPNRRNKIEFYGYDFDKTDIKVKHVVGSSVLDIANHLDQPTHYHMTLNLGGSGVPLNANSKRLILQWNNRNISTIGVIQPEPDICETRFDNHAPSNITVIPNHATMPGKSRGDREFDGNGPRMYCGVFLRNEGNRVTARIYVTARETESDWTYGKSDRIYTIYNADPGYENESVVTSTDASQSYIDNDHALDVFNGSGPVQKFMFNGDGGGNDIGSSTKVTIQFNPIRVQLKETGDCVSSATVRALEISDKISPSLQNKMKTLQPSMKFIAPQELPSVEKEALP